MGHLVNPISFRLNRNKFWSVMVNDKESQLKNIVYLVNKVVLFIKYLFIKYFYIHGTVNKDLTTLNRVYKVNLLNPPVISNKRFTVIRPDFIRLHKQFENFMINRLRMMRRFLLYSIGCGLLGFEKSVFFLNISLLDMSFNNKRFRSRVLRCCRKHKNRPLFAFARSLALFQKKHYSRVSDIFCKKKINFKEDFFKKQVKIKKLAFKKFIRKRGFFKFKLNKKSLKVSKKSFFSKLIYIKNNFLKLNAKSKKIGKKKPILDVHKFKKKKLYQLKKFNLREYNKKKFKEEVVNKYKKLAKIFRRVDKRRAKNRRKFAKKRKQFFKQFFKERAEMMNKHKKVKNDIPVFKLAQNRAVLLKIQNFLKKDFNINVLKFFSLMLKKQIKFNSITNFRSIKFKFFTNQYAVFDKFKIFNLIYLLFKRTIIRRLIVFYRFKFIRYCRWLQRFFLLSKSTVCRLLASVKIKKAIINVFILNGVGFINATLILRYLVLKLRAGFRMGLIFNHLNRSMKYVNRVRGYKVCFAGRVNRHQIATYRWSTFYSMPLNTTPAVIDYACGTCRTRWGVVGIKIWVYKRVSASSLFNRKVL